MANFKVGDVVSWRGQLWKVARVYELVLKLTWQQETHYADKAQCKHVNTPS